LGNWAIKWKMEKLVKMRNERKRNEEL